MFEFCKNLHVYSIKIGLDRDTFVVAELVRLLSKTGEVDHMGKLFKRVRSPDISLYSLLISGYHLHGCRVEAVLLAEEFLALNLNPKQGALVNVINLCLYKEEGKQMHAHIIKTAHLSYLSIGNALISMYIKFGEILDAKMIFVGMLVRDVVSWTAIMAGLVQNLQFEEALETFCALRRIQIQVDQHSISTAVNACTGLRSIYIGQQIHALSLKIWFEFSNFVSASFLHMYSKCEHIESAEKLFSYTSSSRDLILTNVMIAGYCWNSLPHKALDLFNGEHQAGLVPDEFNLSSVLGACSQIKSLEMGEQMHCRVVKSGFDISDVIVGNAIISMYVKCGSIDNASKAFYSMQRQNMNSYETLIMGYLQNKGISEALSLFYRMQQSGFHAKPVAFARILGGCADLAAIDLGKQIHASVMKMGLVSDSYIGNALVGMYAKSKSIHKNFEASMYMSTEDDTVEGNKERSVEDFVPFKLEEEKENFCSYSDVENILPTVEAQRGLKLELLDGNSMLDVDKKCMSFEVSQDMLGEMLAREVGRLYSLSTYASVKFEVMQVEGIIPEHVILLLVFSDVSRFGLFDETFSSISALRRSGFSSNQRASALA
ncbi:uncharacterized protein A4U43_C08F6200 [Asparagus officinalis]|nr:uncharacterized protein A4U43_C08F6200 [Asparagus officinalis]